MITKPTVAEIAKDIENLTALRGCFARPQKLSWVGSRLYWLEGMTQELYHVDAKTDATEPLAPQRTIVVAQSGDAPSEAVERKLTKEEELLRERQRTIVRGISWYSVREADGVVFYISAMSLFVYSPRHKKTLRVFDFLSADVKTLLGDSACINIQNVADDGTLSRFTFVCSGNVYTLDIVGERFDADQLDVEVKAVTTSGKPLSEFGTADYIMQEEFDRYSGQCAKANSVLILHTDTSMLRKVSIPAESGDVEELPFPRVGDPNAVSSVAVFNRVSNVFASIPNVLLEEVFARAFPASPTRIALEYITRFGFVDVDTIYLQLLDRKQENCAIISLPIALLVEVEEAAIPRTSSAFHDDASHLTSTKGVALLSGVNVLWAQTVPFAWCEVTNALSLGTSPQLLGAHAVASPNPFFHVFSKTAEEEWHQLTSGDWNVVARSVALVGKRVYFESNIGDRLGNVLSSVSANGREVSPNTISQSNERVHGFVVSKNEQFVAYVASTSTELASLRLVQLGQDGSPVASSVRDVPLDWELKHNTTLLSSIVLPRIVTYTNPRGVPISGAVFLPKKPSDEGSRLPLMLYVYGGPHVQLVYSNALELACGPTIQALLMRGIAVAVVDNQMSNANHLRDLSVCKKRMGQFEVEEYVSFKQQLCADAAYSSIIDSDRVGVFGWSYGGYATLLCMAQAQQEFKLGYAGAPVGDWRLYDTGYTERYMGLLADKDDQGRNSYEDGLVSRFAAGFPDDIDRLYIAHGLLDENVHFSHTCDVVSALVEHYKPYHMLVYPGERHGLRQKKVSRTHHDALMIATIMQHL